jgi:hypothetical protein
MKNKIIDYFLRGKLMRMREIKKKIVFTTVLEKALENPRIEENEKHIFMSPKLA